MAEWSKFGISLPGSGASSDALAVLSDVHHVAHARDARRIIEDGRMKARPVYDESILNSTRTHVTWVSPNTWNQGSIYGTVAFSFPWGTAVEGKHIYWVEAITKYSPSACRFLVTDQVNPAGGVKPYDPNIDDGPLRYSKGTWYWNSKICLELMLEQDLPLADCREVRFVRHHPAICRLHRNDCAEQVTQEGRSTARTVAFILGSGSHGADNGLLPDVGLPKGRRSTTAIETGLSHLYFSLSGRNKIGGAFRVSPEARSVVRAAMVQYALGRRSQARRLVRLLASAEVLLDAMQQIARRHFKVDYINLS